MSQNNQISFADLRAVNVERCPLFGHGLNAWNALEWAGAMCGEAGEAANIAKKIRRLADGCNVNAPNPAGLRVQLGEELADVVIYADLLAASEGIDLAAAVCAKFNEVSGRVGYTKPLAPTQPSGEAMAKQLLQIADEIQYSMPCHRNDVHGHTIRAAAAQLSHLQAVREAAKADTARLDALDEHLKDAGVWRDTLLAWDRDDGVWLAEVERGTMHALPMESKGKHKDVRAAIDAALAAEQKATAP